jgi:outer membrane protein, multidrug efflux system
MQPIYNKGINRANLKRAEARQQQALFTFQQAILVAGQEVSDALYAYEICGTRTSIRQKQITALAQSVDFTKELLTNNSATNYNDVITAEQALLSAQLSAVNDQLQKKLALVSLYHALGGGWH